MKLLKISFNIYENKARGPQVQGNCSPTATALGSSAIVKVPGQNCFRALCASLGQIRLGPGFQQGAPRFHQSSSSFVVSLALWSRSVLGCQEVPPRFHQGSAKVPPRLQPGFTKVPPRLRSGLLWQIRLAAERFRLKRFRGRFHRDSTKVSPRFHRGHARFVISLVFWGRSVLGRQKVLWKVPPSLL